MAAPWVPAGFGTTGTFPYVPAPDCGACPGKIPGPICWPVSDDVGIILGYMAKHYSSELQRRRLRTRWGDPIKRFWSMVDVRGPDDCWPWKGVLGKEGYGRCRRDGKTSLSHRLAYKLHYGSIDESLQVYHKCDNRPCCNPKHLFQGTALDNRKDCVGKGRHQHGATHHAAKLNEDWVRFIRVCAAEKIGSYKEIGDYFGIAAHTVWKVVTRRLWPHVL
jgi:hypothetical protein